MPDFLSPAAAYTSSLEGYMQHRELLQHQAQQEALARQHEDRLNRQAEAELALREKEAEERIRDKKIAQTEKAIGTMEPGDIPPPNLVANARELSIPIRLAPPKPVQPAAPDMIASPDASANPESTPTGTGVLPGQPQQESVVGSFKQREAVDQKQKIEAIQQRIRTAKPGSDEYTQALIDYEMEKNGQIPAGAFKGATDNTAPVFRQNAASGKVEQLVNGQFQPWTGGNVPAHAHWMTEPQPKDTSARDARELSLFNTAHQQAVKEWEDAAKPVKSHLDSAAEMTQMLKFKTPVTDKLVSPLVLKAIIAGQGSGFRMTRAEIDNITHGRSRWQDLDVAVNKWSANPSAALDLSDTQREDLLALAREVRSRAQKSWTKLTEGRHRMDDAKNPSELYHISTQLQESLHKQDDEPQNYDLEFNPTTGTFKQPGVK